MIKQEPNKREKRKEMPRNSKILKSDNMQISSKFLLLLHTSYTPRIKPMKIKWANKKYPEQTNSSKILRLIFSCIFSFVVYQLFF